MTRKSFWKKVSIETADSSSVQMLGNKISFNNGGTASHFVSSKQMSCLSSPIRPWQTLRGEEGSLTFDFIKKDLMGIGEAQRIR